MIYDKIISDKDCNTIVVNEEFLYPYVYVYILQLNRADGTTQHETIIREYVDQKIKFGIKQDGFYTLCKLKIKRNDLSEERFPNFKTVQMLYEEMAQVERIEFIKRGLVYYSDGKFYYKEPNKTLDQVRETTIEELVQLNHTITDNIDVTYYYYFQVCKLRACYNKLAQKILDQRSGIKCNVSNVNKEDIYRRDLVWSALNTILYMAEQEQFEEAQRLLESIVGCNGLCDNEHSNCGCQ